MIDSPQARLAEVFTSPRQQSTAIRVAESDASILILGEPGTGRSRLARAFHQASRVQAASLVEALEAGASGLLLDEDTSATNFMVRDARMQALIQKQHEPITDRKSTL